MLSSKSSSLAGLLAMSASMTSAQEAIVNLGRALPEYKLDRPVKSRKSHPNAQPSFRLKKQDKAYPFSSTRQDERQRRQFQRAAAKAAAKAPIVTVEADGSTKTTWADSEGYHSLWTNVPDPGPIYHTPHASVPTA